MNNSQRQVIAEKIGSTVRALELLGLGYQVGPPKRRKAKGPACPRVVTVDQGPGEVITVYNSARGSTSATDSNGAPIQEVKSIEDLYNYLKKRSAKSKGRGSKNRNVRSGVYAISLKTPGLLKPILDDDATLLYVGMSNDLETREVDNHFDSDQTGFSTVRRSIGAMLKEHCRLTACPRGQGRSKADFTNFRFEPGGEKRLTAWMRQNLSVSTWPTRQYKARERELIRNHRPPLNLEKGNPKNKLIRSLRKLCADEAREMARKK